MTTLTPQRLNPAASLPSLARASENTRMYAIAFDMDIESLRNAYGDPYNNA